MTYTQYIPQSCRKKNAYQPHSNSVHQLYNNISPISSQNEKCFRKSL